MCAYVCVYVGGEGGESPIILPIKNDIATGDEIAGAEPLRLAAVINHELSRLSARQETTSRERGPR